MSAIIPESLSSQAQTALRWFSLFAQANFDELETVLMDDFMHYVRPASAGVPPGDKVESVFNWMGFRELFDGEVKYAVRDVVECPGKVFLLVALDGVSKNGQPISHDFGYNFRVESDKNGVPKISEIRAFVDTMWLTTFFPEEADRNAALEDEEK